MLPAHLHLVYKILEMIGYAAAGLSAIYGAGQWVMRKIIAVVKNLESVAASLSQVNDINTNVNSIMTNHLPHLQAEVAESKKNFEVVCGDIKNLSGGLSDVKEKVIVIGTNQDRTDQALHRLGTMFVRHLDRGDKNQL